MNQTWNDVVRELYDSAYKQGAIDELEKIKNKIKNECILHEEWFIDMQDLNACLKIIDIIFAKESLELKKK